jgi:hypothetical protein
MATWHFNDLQEMNDLREQAKIWSDSHPSEGDKRKTEAELLSGQLLQRSNELSSIREQLTEARAERDRALQERQQVCAWKRCLVMIAHNRLLVEEQDSSLVASRLSLHSSGCEDAQLAHQLRVATCTTAASAATAAAAVPFIRSHAVALVASYFWELSLVAEDCCAVQMGQGHPYDG